MKIKYTVEEHERTSNLLVEYKCIMSLAPMSKCELNVKGRFSGATESFYTKLSDPDTDGWLKERQRIFRTAMEDATNEYFKYLEKELGL